MMQSKMAFLLTAVAILAIALGLKILGPKQHRMVYLGTTPIRAEVVVTPQARAEGLSGRSGLAEGEGMLFVFSGAERHAFWMKGVSFPIDIIWMRKGVIVDIAPNVPGETSGEGGELPVYYPRGPADRVLEVPAGTAERAGVKIGDRVQGA